MSIAERAEWLCRSDHDDDTEEWGWGERPDRYLRRHPEYLTAVPTLAEPESPIRRLQRLEGEGAIASSRSGRIDIPVGLQETLRDIRSFFPMAEQPRAEGPGPSIETVFYANSWVTRLFSEVERSGNRWVRPNVVTNPDGEIVFTWWHDERILTIYIDGEHAEYLESWGPNIRTEMSGGPADSPAVYRRLWSRLLRG